MEPLNKLKSIAELNSAISTLNQSKDEKSQIKIIAHKNIDDARSSIKEQLKKIDDQVMNDLIKFEGVTTIEELNFAIAKLNDNRDIEEQINDIDPNIILNRGKDKVTKFLHVVNDLGAARIKEITLIKKYKEEQQNELTKTFTSKSISGKGNIDPDYSKTSTAMFIIAKKLQNNEPLPRDIRAIDLKNEIKNFTTDDKKATRNIHLGYQSNKFIKVFKTYKAPSNNGANIKTAHNNNGKNNDIPTSHHSTELRKPESVLTQQNGNYGQNNRTDNLLYSKNMTRGEDLLPNQSNSTDTSHHKKTSQNRVIIAAGLFAAAGLIIGSGIGVALVATGIFAPLGVGVLGLVATAATIGGGLAFIGGAFGFTAAKMTEQAKDKTIEAPFNGNPEAKSAYREQIKSTDTISSTNTTFRALSQLSTPHNPQVDEKINKKNALEFVNTNKEFFSCPFTDQETFKKFFVNNDAIEDIKEYSDKLIEILSKEMFSKNNYHTPLLILWKQGNFEQALENPKLCQFIIDNQNHEAINIWKKKPPLSVIDKISTEKQSEQENLVQSQP